MSEEAVEVVEEQSFDMDGAVESLGSDLFGVEPEATEELEEEISDEPEIEVEDDSEEEIEDSEDEDEAVEKRAAPQSWKKEMREFYDALDPKVQDYIIEREEQMREGLEKDRTDANLGRDMRDMLTPYQHLFDQRGIEPSQAIKGLLESHNLLTNGSQEQKIQMLQWLAQSYGIGQQPQSDNPEISKVMQELQQVKNELQMSQQKARQREQAQVESEVSAFAEAHPYFDDVSDEIAKFVSAGYELEEAYEKAIWANPVTRQKEIDRLNDEKSKETESRAKKAAEAAKKAKSVNVKGRNTRKAPTAPVGTMDDTLNEVYREIASRTS